jgi:hypothetical protein
MMMSRREKMKSRTMMVRMMREMVMRGEKNWEEERKKKGGGKEAEERKTKLKKLKRTEVQKVLVKSSVTILMNADCSNTTRYSELDCEFVYCQVKVRIAAKE